MLSKTSDLTSSISSSNLGAPSGDVIKVMNHEEYTKIKSRNKRNGILWLVVPLVSLPLILSAYAIASFVINSLISSGGTTSSTATIAQIIRVVLGLLGVSAAVGIIVGIPLGIIYLSKRVVYPGMKFDSRSGRGAASDIPTEIDHWNWGAAGLTWIWGATHRVWVAFLAFVPLVNIFVLIYLGVKGNELAWRAEKWESVEAFLESQRRWKIWGIVFFILIILSYISKLGSSGN